MSGTNESLLQANITLKKYHKIHKRTFLPLFGRYIILKDNTVISMYTLHWIVISDIFII